MYYLINETCISFPSVLHLNIYIILFGTQVPVLGGSICTYLSSTWACMPRAKHMLHSFILKQKKFQNQASFCMSSLLFLLMCWSAAARLSLLFSWLEFWCLSGATDTCELSSKLERAYYSMLALMYLFFYSTPGMSSSAWLGPVVVNLDC